MAAAMTHHQLLRVPKVGLVASKGQNRGLTRSAMQDLALTSPSQREQGRHAGKPGRPGNRVLSFILFGIVCETTSAVCKDRLHAASNDHEALPTPGKVQSYST